MSRLETESSDGRAALERFAPKAGRTLTGLEPAMWRAMAESGQVDLIDLVARVTAGQHGLTPLQRPQTFGPSPWTEERTANWRESDDVDAETRAAVRFAAQMSFHVGSLQPAERRAFVKQFGTAAGLLAQAIYVAEFVPRARFALDTLFGPSVWADDGNTAPPGAAAGDLPTAIDELIRVVPGLQALDPVTTEIVRVLGARRHQCRVCQSVRSRSALVAGADDAVYDAIDRYETSSLPPQQKAALALADAMVTTPGGIAPEVVDAVRKHFEPAAQVELVLDVTRNATNKVAVALEADAPRVETGYEVYDVTPDGEIHYGLEAP